MNAKRKNPTHKKRKMISHCVQKNKTPNNETEIHSTSPSSPISPTSPLTTTSSSTQSNISPEPTSPRELTSPPLSPRAETLRTNDSSWFLFQSLSPTLTSLALSNCDLQSVPLSICQCVNLTSLDLSHNYLRRLPPQLASLTSLHSLFLDQTKLTELPPFFSQFILLKELSLSRNYIAVFPECILSLTSLVSLDLSYNDLSLRQNDQHNGPQNGHTEDFPFDTISQTHPHLTTLNIAGNPCCLSLTDPKWIPERYRQFKFIRGETSLPEEIIPSLYLGTTICSFNKHALMQLGVTHVLSIIPRWVPVFPSKFKYKIFEVEDKEQANIKQYFREAIDFIKNAIYSNGVVLIHCSSGLSRSATVLAAYLICEHRMTLKTSLETIRKRKDVCPNAGFIKQLEQWEASEMPLAHWSSKITNALF
eukprot:TRINITY_DN3252_c0_g1_i1.p1 TRINITY_DN3252_c0_g1~~TRINITY_DN3252_c0_g1_i1.p1  ORF type:complete len:420 (-),score=67.37 TRINITY_DN3252_c0_g1_i1:74-1333(-)